MPLEPEGATPAIIRNHAFVPDGAWWTKCEACGLSEAAHETTTLCAACKGSGVMGGPDSFGNYDACPTCEGQGRRL